MNPPRVSVIIPTYNQADYLAESIQSVLDQTFSNIEVIVVDDASTDRTQEVMRSFADPRVNYIIHEANRYAAAARNTGIEAAYGEYVAFLDADDVMHPAKLQAQVAFLDENPDVGLTYNSRLLIDESGRPLAFEPAAAEATLTDLVLDYPFAPSEVVMRKEWSYRVNHFDESFVYHAEDPDYFMRLALEGCKMAGLDDVFNYRRLHAGRAYRNLCGVINDLICAFENTFADPRCPSDVAALRNKSLGKTYLLLSYDAFVQNEIEVGQELIRRAVQFDRSWFDGEESRFLDFLVLASTRDNGDHEAALRSVFRCLPAELGKYNAFSQSAVGQGYLIRGARDIMWDRDQDGKLHLQKAAAYGAKPDDLFVQALVKQLMIYDSFFGPDAASQMVRSLVQGFKRAGFQAGGRKLQGCFSANQALMNYHAARYKSVPDQVVRAILNDPGYLTNRGLLAVLVRSIGR